MTVKFYKGEIINNITNKDFTCYIEAINPLEAENKLLSYIDRYSIGEYGEIPTVSIYNIKPEEYFGMKKLNYGIFI